MRIVQAPEKIPFCAGYRTLFLAGGITNVRNWQLDMCNLLADLPDLLIYNPRRDTAPEDAKEQIVWEWRALGKSEAISFWFSNETLQLCWN